MSGRKKKHPNYNPEFIMNELLEAVSNLYASKLSLRKIGDELDLDQQKVRKLLCPAKVKGMCSYKSDVGDEVLEYYEQKKTVPEIMIMTGLSRSSVQSYLPYVKVPYKTSEVSANAERLRMFRERQRAVKKLIENPDELWDAVFAFQGYPLKTHTGLRFSYKINDGKLTVNQKEMTITKNEAELAYRKVLKMNGHVSDPMELSVAGATYLYPVFVRFGAISKKGSVSSV